MGFRRATLCLALVWVGGSPASADDFGPQAPSPLWGANRYQDDQGGPRAPSPQWGMDDYRNRQEDVTGPQAPSPNWGATRY